MTGLPRYELLDPIGNGGMANVHTARLVGLGGFDRIIAIKQIKPSLASPDFIARFEREARIGSLLSHPNIVDVHDFGRTDAGYFIAMEYLDGMGLDQVRRMTADAGETVPIPVVLSLLAELCDALDHAHRRTDRDGVPLGIVHRDLSPANLFVRRSGHLKLLDFGVAAMRGCDAREVVGKPSYLAPETIRNGAFDARVDLYAVGVIAWELIAGRPLFRGPTDSVTLANVLRAAVPPPSRFRPDCPTALDAIVLGALERDPDRRTPSAAALRDSLHALMAAAYLDARPSYVERWLAEDRETTLFVCPELTAADLVEDPPPARTPEPVPMECGPAPIVIAPFAHLARLRWARPLAIASALTIVTLLVLSRSRASAAEPVPVTLVATSTPPITEPSPTTRRRVGPAAAREQAARVHEQRVQQAIEPGPELAATQTYFPPDRVQLVRGALSPVDRTRLVAAGVANLHLVSVLMCLDDHGAVVTERVLTPNLPTWLSDNLASDLRSFRFTPYRVDNVATAGCFARQFPIARR